MPVKNTVGICKILFYVMFQKNTSKQIFLSSEIMFQVIFIIRRLKQKTQVFLSPEGEEQEDTEDERPIQEIPVNDFTDIKEMCDIAEWYLGEEEG